MLNAHDTKSTWATTNTILKYFLTETYAIAKVLDREAEALFHLKQKKEKIKWKEKKRDTQKNVWRKY